MLSYTINVHKFTSYSPLCSQVGSESSEFTLDRTGQCVEYDTLQSDPRYVDLENHSPPREIESARSSPVSIGTGSMGTCDVVVGL